MVSTRCRGPGPCAPVRQAHRFAAVSAVALLCFSLSCAAVAEQKLSKGSPPDVLLSAESPDEQGDAVRAAVFGPGGVGYYADLVANPGERPEEYLEKQREVEGDRLQAAESPELYWTGSFIEPVSSSLPPLGYYADIVANPGERPEEYLEKQRLLKRQAEAAQPDLDAFETKSLAIQQSLYTRALGSLAWKSTPWKDTWDNPYPGTKTVGEHRVAVANGYDEIAPAADSPFDSVGTPDSYWPEFDGEKPTLTDWQYIGNVRALPAFRRSGSRGFRADGSTPMLWSAQKTPPHNHMARREHVDPVNKMIMQWESQADNGPAGSYSPNSPQYYSDY